MMYSLSRRAENPGGFVVCADQRAQGGCLLPRTDDAGQQALQFVFGELQPRALRQRSQFLKGYLIAHEQLAFRLVRNFVFLNFLSKLRSRCQFPSSARIQLEFQQAAESSSRTVYDSRAVALVLRLAEELYHAR
jgi:hypothetical protein